MDAYTASELAYKNGYDRRDSEIVRCKDCKNFVNHICSVDGMKLVGCKIGGLCYTEDDFCSHGEVVSNN